MIPNPQGLLLYREGQATQGAVMDVWTRINPRAHPVSGCHHKGNRTIFRVGKVTGARNAHQASSSSHLSAGENPGVLAVWILVLCPTLLIVSEFIPLFFGGPSVT